MRRWCTLSTFHSTTFVRIKEGTTLLLLTFSENELFVYDCATKALWFLVCDVQCGILLNDKGSGGMYVYLLKHCT